MIMVSLLFNQKEWYIPKHSSSVGTVDIQYQPMEVLDIMLYVWNVIKEINYEIRFLLCMWYEG